MSLQIRDIVAWDIANWSQALAFWAEHAPIARGGLACLELGANQGGISAWLAEQGNRVICSDVERSEIKARPLIERERLLELVSFEDVDACNIPYEAAFDVVVFKSLLGGIGYGGIERQREAMRSMYRSLKPGGYLLFAENLRGSGFHDYFRRRFVRWGSNWRYVTIAEMNEFLAPFSRVSYETSGVLGTFGRSETQRAVLARIDRAGLTAAVPPDWRYIIYGIAQK